MRTAALVYAIAFLGAAPLKADIRIESAWARPGFMGEGKTSAVYMRIINDEESAVNLVEAASPVAQKVQLHLTAQEGNITRMRHVDSITCGPASVTELKPGNFHIMLINLNHNLVTSEQEAEKKRTDGLDRSSVPLTLKFSNGKIMEMNVPVAKSGCCGSCHDH